MPRVSAASSLVTTPPIGSSRMGIEFLDKTLKGLRPSSDTSLSASEAAVLRCGAAGVTIVYQRTRAEMPADHRPRRGPHGDRNH